MGKFVITEEEKQTILEMYNLTNPKKIVNEQVINEHDINEHDINEHDINDIKILMRQTTYTEDECKQKLKIKSLEECIKEYLGYNTKSEPLKSTNQNIFKAIREYF